MSSKAAKQLLRREIKQKLKLLTNEEKQSQSAQVTQKLFELRQYQSAKSVALYLSMDDEINTDNILQDIFTQQKKCYIPKYYMDGNRMDMVRLLDMEDYQSLPRTKWNIKQPADNDEREEALDNNDGGGLDLILIPGLAFTREGDRCGRGRGYYDTYLQKAQSKFGKIPTTVALAFNQQIKDEVPTDDHDVKIDVVLFSDQ